LTENIFILELETGPYNKNDGNKNSLESLCIYNRREDLRRRGVLITRKGREMEEENRKIGNK
jgi:hypothetical protein